MSTSMQLENLKTYNLDTQLLTSQFVQVKKKNSFFEKIRLFFLSFYDSFGSVDKVEVAKGFQQLFSTNVLQFETIEDLTQLRDKTIQIRNKMVGVKDEDQLIIGDLAEKEKKTYGIFEKAIKALDQVLGAKEFEVGKELIRLGQYQQFRESHFEALSLDQIIALAELEPQE